MKHTYRIEIDCANCARKVEAAINELPEVESAVLSYVNKTLTVEISNELEVDYPQIEAEIRDTATLIEDGFRMWTEEERPKHTATRYEYDIEIDCANCARKVEEAVSKLPGIKKASIVYVDKRMVIEISQKDVPRYDEIEENIRKTAEAVESGFRMRPRGAVEEEANEKNTLIPRIAVGAVFVAFGLIIELFMDWEVQGWDAQGIGMRLLFVCGLMVVGYDVVFNAFRNIGKARFLDENFLMTVATVGAIIIGEYPESVAVMMFYQIGEYFEGRAVAKTRTAVKALVNLKVPYALVERDGMIVSVKTETIRVGEHVLIKPGEMIPVDGKVIAGNSFVDTKAMTGEAVPRHIRAGDEVYGGYINTEATIRIEALRPYHDSAAAKVLSIIEESAARKSTSERFITKFSKYYTPIVVFGALALALIPSLLHIMDPALVAEGWGYWVNKGLIFLVVSCPCALVVSVPLSYFCGIGNASKKGILIKGSNYIEAISKTKCVVFDKTGTLTKGEFTVHKMEPSGITEEELVEYAAAVEIHSNHPIAKSICAYAGKRTGDGDVGAVNVSGKGVTAEVNSRKVAVGNAGLMSDLGIQHTVSEEVGTHVYVAIDDKYAGHILISDSLKDDAKQAISDLKGMGISSHMLTGDTAAVGHAIAGELGLDGCETDLLPGDKTASLERIMSSVDGSTAFVGDGINDAPSLARADVGCAMGGLGSDAAVEAADLVIIDDRPSKVAEAVRISKKTQSIVWQNIVMALVIKFAILGLTTFTDLVNMWIAVFGDVGVLILAVANATRALGGFRLSSGKTEPETCACGCDEHHHHGHDECTCGHDHHDDECGCGCHGKK